MFKNKKISLDNMVMQSEGNIVSNMGGEKVMLSVQNGKYYNLGQMGGEIWDKIQIPITVNDLIDQLSSQYDVEKEQCKIEVLSFLEHLLTEDLILFKESVHS